MKSVLAATLFLLYATVAEASLDDANKVWRDFKACAKRKPDDILFTCAKNSLASSLVAPEKARLAQMLDLGYDFSSLQDCSSADKIQPTKKIAGEFYCMEIKKKKNGQGYVIFVKESDRLKIESIKFKY